MCQARGARWVPGQSPAAARFGASSAAPGGSLVSGRRRAVLAPQEARVMSGSGVRVFLAEARRVPDGPATPGMHRLEALAEEGAWLGTVTTEPNTLSGWHHHGDYETYIYVLRGSARLDTFDDGRIEHHDAGPGAFIVVPKGVAHREGSASPAGVEAVLVRIGRGQVVFPVDGLPDHD